MSSKSKRLMKDGGPALDLVAKPVYFHVRPNSPNTTSSHMTLVLANYVEVIQKPDVADEGLEEAAPPPPPPPVSQTRIFE